MADRLHPYPMFPQNITPNPLQQPQIPQQQLQSQQPDPRMISALSNPEHARMWQQMNQLQNQYRPQPSGDLATSQMNHQIQGLSHGHGQGQPLVQQIPQHFGLNAPRINPSGPVFHDPTNQPQSLIPSNFPNVSMNNQQQLKAALNINPVMHAGVARQLKMLNQQEMARLQQSGLGGQHLPNQPSAVDMFASSSMPSSQDQIHGSPHPTAQPAGPPGANQGIGPGNQQPGVQKRMMTPTEFQETRSHLFGMISQAENNILSLSQAARSTNPGDPHIQQRINQFRVELANRKEVYNKFVATFGGMLAQQMVNGIQTSNMSHMNAMAHSASQQPQQPASSNAQVQPGFVSANERVAAPYKFPVTNGPSPIPSQSQGSLNQQLPIQSTSIGRPNSIPSRTGGTPSQVPGPLPNNISSNLGSFTGQGGQKVSDQARQSVGIMPLDQQRFESTYAQFCRSQNINPGSRVQIGDGRTVDLHQLHVQVMHEGGATSVTQRDMWAVVGGRLDFIQFPGTDTEPARCGPGIAQQLQNTYEQFLQHFENAYILTVKNRPPTGSPQQPMHQMNPSPLTMGNNATPSISANPTEAPSNPPRQVNPQFIAAALRYVGMSVQDMRVQQVSENMITFVERHRSELVKLYQQQVQLAAQRKAEQEQQNMANGQVAIPNMHEQAPISMQQRLSHPMGANPMVSVAGEAKMTNESLASEALRKLPTQDQVQQATIAIEGIKQLFRQRLAGITPQHVLDEQRPEYSQLLEHVYKMTSILDARLPLYLAVFKSEDLLRKYVAIVLTVARQRELLASSQQYIISTATLRNMQVQVHRLNEEFENRWRMMRASASVAAGNSQQPPSFTPTPIRSNPTSAPVPLTQNISRPSFIPQQPPPQTHLPPPPIPQSNSLPPQTHGQPHTQQLSLPQVIKKNIQTSIPPSPAPPPAAAAITSPTPPPAAVATSSTPATSAPTPQPTSSSPQTPKSPPSKAATKTKPPTRANRRMSAASKGPATPEMAPTSVVGIKRPPEEDIVAAFTNIAPSEAEASNAPSPKKAKTEWEGETSEALVKKHQEIENIKTDEDAALFLDQMKELLAMSASTDEIHHDIASSLGQLLAGVAQEPADAAATAAALSAHGIGDAGPPPTALSPHVGPASDVFSEFLDLSLFTTLDDEDNDSKAPTPDLVPSSETNPSPESGSEGDSLGSTGSPDKSKIDEPSDPLRLGSLREIDGGESAYYQPSDWKWDGPMPTFDQPWAIYNS